jgi:hypothetical protein
VATKTGGTPQTNQDLMGSLSGSWDTWLLHCDRQTLTLYQMYKDQQEIVEQYVLHEQVEPISHSSFEYDKVVENWLMKYDFDLVHIRHLIWHSLSLPRLASKSGAAVVKSFHDFYALCPTVKLLDENNVFCEGKCTNTPGECKIDIWPTDSLPPLKNAWVKQWREKFTDALAWCDMFVTTSSSVKETILTELPELSADRFHIIPHGRDFSDFYQIQPELEDEKPLKILVPGNTSVGKGQDIIKSLLEYDREGKLEIHILGSNISLRYNHPRLIFHGEYVRNDFAKHVERIQPHVGAIFSIWNETWCHTLTELWSVGVPAIVFDFPTVAGRVSKSGAGWVYNHKDVAILYKNIVSEVCNVKNLFEKRLAVIKWQEDEGKLNTNYKMSLKYEKVYHLAIDRCALQTRSLLVKI